MTRPSGTGSRTRRWSSSAPAANFTVSPTSGVAPLAVTFSDTSTNNPTSWAWDFGDGATTMTQNPAHTYAAPGTYTVSLTAANAAGSNTVTRSGAVTVSGQVSSGISVVGSQSAFSNSAVTGVSIPSPAGIAAGDVLVASITSDRNASMTTVPAGWTPMVNGLSINSSASAGARIYAYHHVVAAGESGPYNWVLSSQQKWGAGITAYRGVEQRHAPGHVCGDRRQQQLVRHQSHAAEHLHHGQQRDADRCRRPGQRKPDRRPAIGLDTGVAGGRWAGRGAGRQGTAGRRGQRTGHLDPELRSGAGWMANRTQTERVRWPARLAGRRPRKLSGSRSRLLPWSRFSGSTR